MRVAILTSLLLFLASCGVRPEPVSVRFSVSLNNSPVACDDLSESLTDLRFYVSKLAFSDAEGRLTPVALLRANEWQNEAVALIDLENGAGSCLNGTTATNDRVLGHVVPGEYRGIEFTVGVPFELNHANPLMAEPPLDDSAMHWHWRSGYKFLRAGAVLSGEPVSLHLGSTGCEGTVGDIIACSAANRLRVRFADFDAERDTITIDMARLLNGAAGGCESGPGEIACTAPFAALGLPFGDQSGGPQTVFGLQR